MGDLMPHNDEAEQALLGCVLIDPRLIVQVAQALVPARFYRDRHQRIFEALVSLGDGADLVAVADRLERLGILGDCGGRVYLAGLPNVPATAAQWGVYAEVVRRDYGRRELIRLGQEVIQLGTEDNPEEALDEAQRMVRALRNELPGGGAPEHVRDVLPRVLAERDRIAALPPGEVRGVPYGFPRLDAATGGQHPGQVIVVLAPTGHGKSALVGQFWQAAARGGRGAALLCSNEMLGIEYVQRLLARCGRVALRHVLDPREETEREAGRLSRVMGELAEARLFLQQGVRTVRVMRRAIEAVREREPIAWAGLDWVQLVQASRRSESRVQELDEVMGDLKALAVEYAMPVVVVAQMALAAVRSGRAGPEAARGSGMIGFVADVSIAIVEDEGEGDKDTRRGRLVITKGRNAPRLAEEVQFRGPFLEFVPLDTQHAPPREAAVRAHWNGDGDALVRRAARNTQAASGRVATRPSEAPPLPQDGSAAREGQDPPPREGVDEAEAIRDWRIRVFGEPETASRRLRASTPGG